LAGEASEQAANIEESSSSLKEISSTTRQDAPNPKESASSSEEMDAQANHLCDFIGDLVALVSKSANGRGKDIEKPGF